jgi:hypothetical protein
MTDPHTLHFMGDPAIVETFRCRIYGGEDSDEAARVDFIERLATTGEIDCPAYDGWVAALQARGWLPAAPELEPNPVGPGKVGRWRLTDTGRTAWAAMKGGAP